MQKKYDWPDNVPDEAIKEQFASATEVSFSARRFNHIPHRSISFGDLGWWLPLTRVLPLIGITPQVLRPVFNPCRVVEKKVERMQVRRSFPLNLVEAVGFLKKEYEDKTDYQVKEVELPETIETYEQLGGFPLSDRPFHELARVLGKSVRVLREDGGTGDHRLFFTAHPSGEIVKAAKA